MIGKKTKIDQVIDFLETHSVITSEIVREICKKCKCSEPTGWRGVRRLRSREKERLGTIKKNDSMMTELSFLSDILMRCIQKFKEFEINFKLTVEEKMRLGIIDKMISNWKEEIQDRTIGRI